MDLVALKQSVDRRFQAAARRRLNIPTERSGAERAKQPTEQTALTKTAVDTALKAIQPAATGGDDVKVLNFGTFPVAARQERNPTTGAAIGPKGQRRGQIAAGKAPSSSRPMP